MKQEIKTTRLQLLMGNRMNKQIKILAAYLGGTNNAKGIYKELSKIGVIELAMDELFSKHEIDLLEQLTGKD